MDYQQRLLRMLAKQSSVLITVTLNKVKGLQPYFIRFFVEFILRRRRFFPVRVRMTTAEGLRMTQGCLFSNLISSLLVLTLLYSFAGLAMAEEKEVDVKIGGQYRIMGNSSNFGWHPASITDDEKTRSFFNQRFRTWLTVKPNEKISAYLQVEMGHITWGDDYEFPKTYAVGGDEVGMETRRAFITYQHEDLGNFKMGIQDWSDSFGDVLASSDHDFNLGGLSFTRKLTDLVEADLRLGAFKVRETDPSTSDETDLFTLDFNNITIGENGSLGVSAYYLKDRDAYSYGTFGGPMTGGPVTATYQASSDLWLGVNYQTKFGKIPVRAFYINNKGKTHNPDWDHQGYALGLQGSYKLEWGKLSLQGLYSTGDDKLTDDDSNEFRTIAQGERDNFGAMGYWSYLTVTSPRGPSDVQDLGVTLQNRGLGLTTIQTKLEFPIKKRLSGYTALGWLKSTEDNPVNNEKDMGFEIVGEVTLDLGHGLKIDMGSGYLFTGDFYKVSPTAKDPENLYEVYFRTQLEF